MAKELISRTRRQELNERIAEGDPEIIETLAREQIPLAIETLKSVAESKRSASSSRVQASKELLNRAEGRPTQKTGDTTDRGITVNIQMFSTGATERHHIDVVDISPQEQAVDRLAEGQPAPEPDVWE